MLTAIIGEQGSGKSLLMTYYAYITKLPVIANFSLYLPDKSVEVFDIHRFMSKQYNYKMLLIDEATQYTDARRSMSKSNIDFANSVFQTRKRKNRIYLSYQIENAMDLREKSSCNRIIYCMGRTDFGFHYLREIPKNGSQKSFYIPYYLYEKLKGMYDTYEIIEDKEKTEFAFGSHTDKMAKIKSIAEEVLKYYSNTDKITFKMVELYFFTHNMYREWLKHVYTYIKLNGAN